METFPDPKTFRRRKGAKRFHVKTFPRRHISEHGHIVPTWKRFGLGKRFDVKTFPRRHFPKRFHVGRKCCHFFVFKNQVLHFSHFCVTDVETFCDVETFWEVPTWKRFDVETFSTSKRFPTPKRFHVDNAQNVSTSKRFHVVDGIGGSFPIWYVVRARPVGQAQVYCVF